MNVNVKDSNFPFLTSETHTVEPVARTNAAKP